MPRAPLARVARAIIVGFFAVVAARCGSTAPSCTYSVTPLTASVGRFGDAILVTVSTGASCEWTVTPNVEWMIAVMPSPTRIGSGIVQILVGPNMGAARTGTLMVAGQTVTITQDAPTFSMIGRVRDAWTEVGIEGATVSLSPGLVPSVTTNGSGDYALTGLLAGAYQVMFSKPSFSTVSQAVTVQSNVQHSGVLSVTVPFPPTASDITGHWAVGGAYPNQPIRLSLIQSGHSLSGFYRDAVETSRLLFGAYGGQTFELLVPVPGNVLVFECTVLDARTIRGVLKNDKLGGNFPITMTR